MSTITAPDKRAKKQRSSERKPAGRRNSSTRILKGVATPSSLSTVAKLRTRLGLTQAQFAPLLPVSIRLLATLESGAAPSEPIARRLTELDRLTTALAEVIREESLGQWLLTPNPAFDGLKPFEVIQRGEGDRLWEMIYFLRSGVPS